MNRAQLDQVWFVPNAQSPLKPDGAGATDRQRCEMIEFAIAGHEAFYLSKVEIERGGVSYTVDTVKEIATKQPDDELFFLMGGDSLDSFGQWHQPRRDSETCIALDRQSPGCRSDRPFETGSLHRSRSTGILSKSLDRKSAH